jgi:hypothetical protein
MFCGETNKRIKRISEQTRLRGSYRRRYLTFTLNERDRIGYAGQALGDSAAHNRFG